MFQDNYKRFSSLTSLTSLTDDTILEQAIIIASSNAISLFFLFRQVNLKFKNLSFLREVQKRYEIDT